MVTVRTESPLNGFAAALRLKLRHLNLASPTHESRVVPNSIAPDPMLFGTRFARPILTVDQNGVLVLMWLFNPILTSLRGLQQAGELESVQKKFGVGRASLGSLSESVTIFDPEPLKQIAATLATKVESADPSRFDVIGKQLTAVDGSVFKTAVRVASHRCSNPIDAMSLIADTPSSNFSIKSTASEAAISAAHAITARRRF